jgi:pyruvyltransferase
MYRKFKRLVEMRLPHTKELYDWPQLPYKHNTLTYWHPPGITNFGDELSRTIVTLMLARQGFTLYDEVWHPYQLLAVGSVLHFANNRAVVWGAGLNALHPQSHHIYRNLSVRAVRGPRTREFLRSRNIPCSNIYGDPALLLPLLTSKRFDMDKTPVYRAGFVPNLHDDPSGQILSPEDILINPCRGWNTVVKEILQCERIVSSSLHGLIIADAFGIPAQYVRLKERGGLFKFEDYYEGTGRKMPKIYESVADAIAAKPPKPPALNLEPLMKAFPYDIYDPWHEVVD